MKEAWLGGWWRLPRMKVRVKFGLGGKVNQYMVHIGSCMYERKLR